VKIFFNFFKKTDHVFSLVMLLMLVSAVLIFYKYETWILEPRIRSEFERQKAGFVLENKNITRRRYAGSMTYFDLKKNNNIYLGDTLFTDRLSSLEIRLGLDTKLRLGEMTMVIVERNGDSFQVYMAGGEVSGELAAKDKLQFDIEQERIELQSDQKSEFRILNTKAANLTLEGKGKIRASYRLKTFDLDKSKLQVPKSEVVSTEPAEKNQSTKQKESDSKSEELLTLPKASPIANSILQMKQIPLDMPIPYPADKQVFLIKNRGEVIIVPIAKCISDCEMILTRNGFQVGLWNFKKDETPAAKIILTKLDLGHYKLFLNQNKRESKDSRYLQEFDIKIFSKFEFESALKNGLSVEVMD
jgi:hypothetical protein